MSYIIRDDCRCLGVGYMDQRSGNSIEQDSHSGHLTGKEALFNDGGRTGIDGPETGAEDCDYLSGRNTTPFIARRIDDAIAYDLRLAHCASLHFIELRNQTDQFGRFYGQDGAISGDTT